MLPSLSVLTAGREMPIRKHTHHNWSLVSFSSGYHEYISDERGQDLKLPIFSTI